MKLKVKAVANAEGLVWVVVFVICAFVAAVVPKQTAGATRYLFHLTCPILSDRSVGEASFPGLIVSSIAMVLAGAVWSSIYNRFAQEENTCDFGRRTRQ